MDSVYTLAFNSLWSSNHLAPAFKFLIHISEHFGKYRQEHPEAFFNHLQKSRNFLYHFLSIHNFCKGKLFRWEYCKVNVLSWFS